MRALPVGGVRALEGGCVAFGDDANGTLRFTENPDGSFDLFGTGRNVLIFFPGDMGPNGPVPDPGALYLHEGTTQST